MLPPFYQEVLEKHLTKRQLLTLELLLIMLQSHRQIKLSHLAQIYPQPIQYQSRLRSLQRFLRLPQLRLKLLWFPILKYWLRQQFRGEIPKGKMSTLTKSQSGYLLVALDRTQWRENNLIVASIIWKKHSIILDCELLPRIGSSSFQQQKAFLTPILRLLKAYPIVLVADREFHSPKLGDWLNQRQVKFCLRQKKSGNYRRAGGKYQALRDVKIQPGQSYFWTEIWLHKQENLGPMNLAIYWKRKSRGKGPKAPWYILTNLDEKEEVLSCYRSRWGIETMFKDCKSGGYQSGRYKSEHRKINGIGVVDNVGVCHGNSSGRKSETERASEIHR